jgi:ubiquitin C-terminal hydrolase
VISHYGAASQDHYVAAVREGDSQSWKMFDDERVYLLREQDVIKKDAYVLMFKSTS